MHRARYSAPVLVSRPAFGLAFGLALGAAFGPTDAATPMAEPLRTAAVKMASVPTGEFTPPFRRGEGGERGDTGFDRIPVPSFRLDTRAVTTAEFLSFLREHPRYTRSRIPELFADPGYLKAWKGDLEPRYSDLNAPVTTVSWHAAKAYCSAQGKRLPTTAEWERVAATHARGQDSATQERLILGWYARSSRADVPAIGSGTRHLHGIRDLHGIVWEWTSDFNAWSGGGVNKRGVKEDGLFCGGAPASAAPNTSYTTYMRWGFRGSLKPDYTVATLGFRCARDENPNGD
jgi:sulfatase modifying factor 1